MKRGAPIARRTPLRAKTELKRTELKRSANLRRVRRMRKSAPKPAITARKRRTLGDRSGGWCELRVDSVCLGAATDAAHRAGRGMGGQHGPAAALNGRLANYLHSCRACHNWCHGNPVEAAELGWLLAKAADHMALEIPAVVAGVRSLLDDEGGVTPCASS